MGALVDLSFEDMINQLSPYDDACWYRTGWGFNGFYLRKKENGDIVKKLLGQDYEESYTPTMVDELSKDWNYAFFE